MNLIQSPMSLSVGLFGVSHGRTDGGEVLERWRSLRTLSGVMAERTTGASGRGGVGMEETEGPEERQSRSVSKQR